MTLSVGSGVVFLVHVLICLFRLITASEWAFRLRSPVVELP